MKLAVVCATARANGLDRLTSSLQQSVDGLYAIAELDAVSTLPKGWRRVPFVPPPWYCPEMALNVGADQAFADGHDAVLFLADLVWFDPGAVALAKRYLASTLAPVLSGVVCWHDTYESQCDPGKLAPDLNNMVHNIGPGAGENIETLKQLRPLAGPVAARAHLIYFICTVVRRDVWDAVNGIDERFSGAHSFFDTNFARRVEKVFGPCHLHTGFVAHRLNYTTNALLAPKKKLWGDQRNALLEQRLWDWEVRYGRTRAVRSYCGAETPFPKEDPL